MNKLNITGNTEEQNVQLGRELFNQGLRYTQIPNIIDGGVKSAIYRGWDEMAKQTRCGYLLKHWNKCGASYKSSSDIRTLFT